MGSTSQTRGGKANSAKRTTVEEGGEVGERTPKEGTTCFAVSLTPAIIQLRLRERAQCSHGSFGNWLVAL
jgi:hypothetical protein